MIVCISERGIQLVILALLVKSAKNGGLLFLLHTFFSFFSWACLDIGGWHAISGLWWHEAALQNTVLLYHLD